jgi:hypothetical protein
VPDLRWEDILTPREREHYERFLGAGIPVTFIHPDREQPWKWSATTITPERPAAALREIEQRKTRDGILVRNGFGPDTCSSSQELALAVEWSWDVCGYYRRLGLHWSATRKQIRDALMRLRATVGAGRADLIYAATQLLDEETRREYDRTPLGTWFLKDKDTEEAIKRAAQAAASAMAARGFPETTPDDVLGSWGLRATPRGGSEGEGRPGPGPRSAVAPPAGQTRWTVRWSWYADLDSGARGYPEDLERWQLLLIRAFAARGMKVRFAIGIGVAETFEIRPAPDPRILVVLLGRGEPTQEMADEAAASWGLARENREPS